MSHLSAIIKGLRTDHTRRVCVLSGFIYALPVLQWGVVSPKQATTNPAGGFFMTCVYFIQKGNRDVYKVGMSGGSAEARLRSLQTGSDEPLALCAPIKCGSPHAAAELERRLHSAFEAKHLSGEWFGLTWTDIQG